MWYSDGDVKHLLKHLFPPDFKIHPEWYDHKWHALRCAYVSLAISMCLQMRLQWLLVIGSLLDQMPCCCFFCSFAAEGSNALNHASRINIVKQNVWCIYCTSSLTLWNYQALWTKPANTPEETTGDMNNEKQKDSCGFCFCSYSHETWEDILRTAIACYHDPAPIS